MNNPESIIMWRENNPPVVDELVAALELCPPTERELDRPEEWLFRMRGESLLNPRDYGVMLDLLTAEY